MSPAAAIRAMSSSAASRPRRRGELDTDRVAREIEGRAVEHDDDLVIGMRSHEALEIGDQPPHRAAPVAPPAVGPRPDHVHPVDEVTSQLPAPSMNEEPMPLSRPFVPIGMFGTLPVFWLQLWSL